MTIDMFLLSVIIPTRNRQRYAASSIRQVMAATSPDIEVVVQDNSDVPSLQTDLTKLLRDEPRVSYEHRDGRLSFSDNFDLAVRRARGAYVAVIGDDDGVLPILEETARWAHRHRIHAVTPALSGVYYWPGSVSGSRAHLDSSLVVSLSKPRARLVDPRRSLRRLFARGAVDYLSLPMVKAYHGLVSRELLDEVNLRTDRYFSGLSPDIYASVALSLVTDQVLVINWPLTLPGVCATSGSADSASGRHTGKLSDAPHFRGNADYVWSARVPPVYCVETIWAETALNALRDVGGEDFQFGESALRRIVRRRHPSLRAEVPAPKAFDGLAAAWSVIVGSTLRRVCAKARRLVNRPRVVHALPDIESAVQRMIDESAAAGLTSDALAEPLETLVRSR